MAEIDVTEILKNSQEPLTKRSRRDNAVPPVHIHGSQAEVLAALEDHSAQAANVDESLVKKLVSQLEKKVLRNREMRIKYTGDPKKFMDSEMELDTAIQEMHILATQPDLYGVLVECNAPSILLQLLSHENTDIIGNTVNLMQELTDIDILSEGEEGAEALIEALAQGRVIESIVTALSVLDESNKDDADAVHNALTVVENILDFRPETSEECVQQGLFHWLLKRACQKGSFDANKMFASELLASILQTNDIAKENLTVKLDGIDLLLRALATYKRHDPSSMDEREHMENLFDALCASLMYAPNRKKFLDGEGLQLMNLMLRERKQSRESALKVLDHATTGPEGVNNCAKFIEILGLRTLFPLFMRTPAKVKRKDTTPDEHEEHVCAIMAALMRSVSEDARQRIMQKFVEHEHEKVDRAVELFLKYKEKVSRWENMRLKRDDSESDHDRQYLDKLDAGLYTLQNITLVLADISAHTNSARQRTIKLLDMKTKTDRLTKHFIPLLAEYQSNLGEDADEERHRCDLLIARLTAAEKAQ